MPQKSMGLLEEANRMAKLDHPNIVKLIAVSKLSFQAFRPMIAMEWLPGGSLAEYFREHIRVSNSFKLNCLFVSKARIIHCSVSKFNIIGYRFI